jgi:hypothetical protein
MSRLPVPGSDDGTWGAILNDFLAVEHDADGTLKIRSLITAKGQLLVGTGGGTLAALSPGSDGQVLGADSTQASGLRWINGGSGSSTLAGNTDVAISGPSGGQVLTYNNGTGKWVNLNPAVISVAGKTGTVALAASDVSGVEQTANKGAASGYAPLDGSSKVPLANLPLPLTQANTHASPDTDTATTALHHTLGVGANQAAAGNHTHTFTFSLPAYSKQGVLAVTTGTLRLPVDGTYTIVGTRLMAGTAPTGSNIVIDVNKNGATIYATQGNRPVILAGANSGGPGTVPDVTALAAGDYLTVDIDQVGSSVAGSDLTVTVIVSKIV